MRLKPCRLEPPKHLSPSVICRAGARPATSLRSHLFTACFLRNGAQVMSRYKFGLAFENTREPDYITEKVFEVIEAGTFARLHQNR